MTKSPELFYLDYVLGIDDFLVPEHDLTNQDVSHKDSVEIASCQLSDELSAHTIFLVESPTEKNTQTVNEMLEKIIQALQLKFKISVKFFTHWQDNLLENHENAVVFAKDQNLPSPKNEINNYQNKLILSLCDFESMLLNPELKKITWQKLKEFTS